MAGSRKKLEFEEIEPAMAEVKLHDILKTSLSGTLQPIINKYDLFLKEEKDAKEVLKTECKEIAEEGFNPITLSNWLTTLLEKFEITTATKPDAKAAAVPAATSSPPPPTLTASVSSSATPAVSSTAPTAASTVSSDEKKEVKPLERAEVKQLAEEIAKKTLDNLATHFFTTFQTNLNAELKQISLELDQSLFSITDEKVKTAVIESLVPPTEKQIEKEVKKLVGKIKTEDKITDNPLDLKENKDANLNRIALQTELIKIQKEYSTKTNAAFRAKLYEIETKDAKEGVGTSLQATAPGFSLASITPLVSSDEKKEVKEGEEKIADRSVLRSLKSYLLQHGGEIFSTHLQGVIKSEVDLENGKPNDVVTNENLAELTSLNHQYRAIAEVKKIVDNLAENKVLDGKDTRAIVATLQSPAIIKSLSNLWMDNTQVPSKLKELKKIKDNATSLRERLITIIKSSKKLDSAQSPLKDEPVITDPSLIAALETSRQNYSTFVLQDKLNQEIKKITDIKTTLDKISDTKQFPDIDLSEFNSAISAMREGQQKLTEIENELAQLQEVDKTKISELNKQIVERSQELKQNNDIITHIETVDKSDQQLIATLPKISLESVNIIEGKSTGKSDSKTLATAKQELENAINALPKINERLNELGNNRIRIKQTRESLEKNKNAIITLQNQWETNSSLAPLQIKKQVELAETLKSIHPEKLRTTYLNLSKRHDGLRRAINTYTDNWRATRDANILGGFFPAGHSEAGKPNEYLGAIEKALEVVQGQCHLDRINTAIQAQIDKLQNKKSLTGKPLSPTPKDKEEIQFFTLIKSNFETLKAEMKVIKTQIEQRKNPTHTISSGAEPHAYKNYQELEDAFKKLNLDQQISKNLDLKSAPASGKACDTGSIYKESLSARGSKDYDEWTLYHSQTEEDKSSVHSSKKKMTDPAIPVICTHESRTNGIRRSEDYILSITPSDQSILIDILMKHATLLDPNNPGQELKSNRNKLPLSEPEKIVKWKEILEHFHAPICLDNMEKLKNLVKSLSESTENVRFNEPLANFTYQRGDDIDLRTKKIANLLDKERYDDGMPKPAFIKIAKDYLERKFDDIQNNRCPHPVVLSSNSKPLMQVWKCILANSPAMRNVFTIDPANKFNATPQQLKMATEDPRKTYIPRTDMAKLAGVSISDNNPSFAKPRFG